MLSERVKHTLTGYHYRSRDGGTIVICSCGWMCATFRRVHRRTRIRGLLCLVRGHRWDDEPSTAEVGPVGFKDGEGHALGRWRQCDYCSRLDEVGGGH